MIGGCVRSNMCRDKLKGKREAYCLGMSCDLVFAAEFHRQPIEVIQQWCYMVSLSVFFRTSRAALF